MDKADIKKKLEKLGDCSLKDVETSYVEVILERMKGNRTATKDILGISMSKMRRYISSKKVFAKDLKLPGRPRAERK